MPKQRTTVAFQGEHGAYSEQAVYSNFGKAVVTKPKRSLQEVFDAVERGIASHAMIPVENSLEGSVNETYDLLLRFNLKVSGEVELKIIHCLIAYSGTSVNEVKQVYSHLQALSQCRRFLEGSDWEIIPSYDTAGSVKMIKERNMKRAAAIAGEIAAHTYGMKVIRRGIQDEPNNYTRFFIISKDEATPTGRDKTSIVFSVEHKPGTLFQALEPFAKRGLNLTKIESRPTRQKPWEYHFFLDFEGHLTESRCKEALADLEGRAALVKVLGSYPKAAES